MPVNSENRCRSSMSLYQVQIKNVIVALMAMILMLATAYVLPIPIEIKGVASYLPLHTALEVIAIVISMLVFATGWNGDSAKLSGNIVLLSCVFFGIGTLDFSHTLSFAGMPDFVTPSNPEKAINFWLAARFLASMSLLTIAVRTWQPFESAKPRYFLILTVLTFTAFCHWVFLYHEDVLPKTFVPHQGLTAFKINCEYVLLFINVLTSLLLLHKMRTPQSFDIVSLFGAVNAMALSEFSFTLYADVTDIFNLLGHIFKSVSYLYIYRAIFVSSVKQPYQLLEKSQAQLQTTLDALQQSEHLFKAIFTQAAVGLAQVDTASNRFIWANPRFEEILGMTLEQMQMSSFVDVTHPDDVQESLENMKKIRHGLVKSFSLEKRYVRPDGSIIWVILTVSPLWKDGETVSTHVAVVQDITKRKRYEEKLHLASKIFQTTLESIMVTDSECRLIEVNEAFIQITGYKQEEVLGKKPSILKSNLHDLDFYRAMWHTINTTDHWGGEIWNQKKDGQIYPEWLSISVIRNEKNEITNYVGISSDITLLKQHEKQLEHLAHYDALTKIPNRVLLMDRMKQAMTQSLRQKKLLAVCYMDLDGFKPINDNFGHETGDVVLKKIAERVSNHLRGGDTIARLGGDEFVILLLNIENDKDCHNSLHRLSQIIAEPINIKNQSFKVTASIGVALYPHDNEDADTLLRNADHAMYAAKHSGKNRFYIFDPKQEFESKLNQKLRDRVKQGLEQHEFELFYQPKVNLKTKKITGAEALIRWQHPERGLLPPIEFLYLIENSDLDILFGEWVIDTALKQLKLLQEKGIDIEVSINITADHLQSSNFIGNLTEKLFEYSNINPNKLQIEILETAALSDDIAVSEIMRTCNKLGVSFALDDFGTGYSSLSYLRKLPADTLKIDQSFIRDMLHTDGDYEIVQGIIALAKTFNLKTVAEGVETQAHFQTLLELDCEIGQGYGIAKPMPSEIFCNWVQTWESDDKNRVHTYH